MALPARPAWLVAHQRCGLGASGAVARLTRMERTTMTRAAAAALAAGLLVPAAAGAQGPPPPTATNAQAVKTLAQGVPTPTEFACFKRNVFVSAYGPETGTGGGV